MRIRDDKRAEDGDTLEVVRPSFNHLVDTGHREATEPTSEAKTVARKRSTSKRAPVKGAARVVRRAADEKEIVVTRGRLRRR